MKRYATFTARFALAPMISGCFVVSMIGPASWLEFAHAVTGFATIYLIIGLLIVMLGGIAFLVRIYHITATDPGKAGYQSVLSLIVMAVAGRGIFYYIAIGSVLVVLALSANTAFQNVALTAELLAQANKGLDLAQARYNLGLGSIVELSQAQLNQAQAGIAQASAKYDYATRLAELAYQEGALR